MGAVEAGAESQQAVDDEEEQEEAGLYPPQPGQNFFYPSISLNPIRFVLSKTEPHRYQVP